MAIKPTKRKGFNFFRSYYDVYNELESDKDKVAFIDALLDRQFLGIIPTTLTGMAKFAYISQTNSIDSQVKGYNDKAVSLGHPPLGVYAPPPVGVNLPPATQEEVEVEGQGEHQDEKPKKLSDKEITDNFLHFFNLGIQSSKGKLGQFKTLSKTDLNNLKKLKEAYVEIEDWKTAFKEMVNSSWVIENNMATPAHYLRNENFQKYLNAGNQSKKFKAPWD